MPTLKRRELLSAMACAPLAGATLGLASCLHGEPCEETREPSACAPTASDVEGPFYTAGAPTRDALAEPDQAGDPIIITGRLLDADGCERGLVGYILDLWHADDEGVYDNEGFTLRGRITTDAAGAFRIETIMPGSYPDRPQRHIHLKVRRPDQSVVITTQIYFEGDPARSCDDTGPRVLIDDGQGELDLMVSA